jgi:hypothetical protein
MSKSQAFKIREWRNVEEYGDAVRGGRIVRRRSFAPPANWEEPKKVKREKVIEGTKK